MKIGHTYVSADGPTYFIADIASNHRGSHALACELVRVAASVGAQAAKFQSFRARTLVSDYGFQEFGKASHQSSWDSSVYKTFETYEVPLEWVPSLRKCCNECGIDFFTSPYDINDLEYLDKFCAAWKVGSGDITYHQLLKALDEFNKPIILATGASTLREVGLALACIRRNPVVLMQCNTNYTASWKNYAHINLNVLKAYQQEFPNAILGLSDHTTDDTTVLGAIALGARVVEKHLRLRGFGSGPDHHFSLAPMAFTEMTLRVRRLETALGRTVKCVERNERDTVVMQRRACCAAAPISANHPITREDIAFLRPCPEGAFPPYRADELVGCVALCDIPQGAVLDQTNLSPRGWQR